MATQDFKTSAAKAFREHYDKLVDSIQEAGGRLNTGMIPTAESALLRLWPPSHNSPEPQECMNIHALLIMSIGGLQNMGGTPVLQIL